MKRFFVLLLLIPLILSGCNKVSIDIVDGTYTCGAQEFVELLNSATNKAGDDSILRVPDFSTSGKEIDLSENVSITLTENKSGKLREIELIFITGA